MSSARERRDTRIAAAHAQRTAPHRWRCMVEGCPDVGVYVVTTSYEAAVREADQHYDRLHYDRDWTPPPGFELERARFLRRTP